MLSTIRSPSNPDEGPLLETSNLFYRLGSECNFCCFLMLFYFETGLVESCYSQKNPVLNEPVRPILYLNILYNILTS
jgi:hypothetical protein